MGIFAPLKTKVLQIKKNISRKLVIRLAIFIAVIGVATILDVYFEKNPESVEDIHAESANNSGERSKMYFVYQTNTFNAKTSVQKNLERKLQVKSQDKLVQKYHQLRNYQVLKAEVQSQTTPLILSYHYLVFKNYFFTVPDDDPLIS